MAHALSIHIGLNAVDPVHYQGWSGPLIACENDAHTMQRICAGRGFTPQVLLTRDATRDAVIAAIRDAAGRLGAGDDLVISYSGHGGQIPDTDGDESDTLDETWCLFDGELIDDELFALWAGFAPGVRIAVLSDSCHSGTVVKMALLSEQAPRDLPTGLLSSAGAPKAMPPEVQMRTYLANQAFYDDIAAAARGSAPVACPVLLVSGCQDNQLSYDGPFNGAFTGALASVFRNGAFRGTYADLANATRMMLRPDQSPNYYAVGAHDPAFEAAPCFRG
ncbi:caspase family protein [Sphingomonas canadensis]|uniref:Caspase family protein n=1 Tax=Sphingomonas canadensis TaxID=1219257 RepID=A0ABW3H1W2_9SPHN|nr:caspase family protein [Sphingomonas canadensis]MCW3835239.1 caspase family protein [Sphingomonas canadensis]